jgi:hypothetical protein
MQVHIIISYLTTISFHHELFSVLLERDVYWHTAAHLSAS